MSGTTTRPLLAVRELSYDWSGRPARRAPRGPGTLQSVSFDIGSGEALAVVGETGSGKTTLARVLLQMPAPHEGSVTFLGHDLTRLRGAKLRRQRRKMQAVFQDPYGSLDPTWRVADIVAEPLVGAVKRYERARLAAEALECVGLPVGVYGRRLPRQLSGGQCQRVAIARALVVQPRLVVCDEAVSSLDAVTQAQVLELLAWLRAELGLAYLFISHDLVSVRYLSDRVAVLYRGRICESGPTDPVFARPAHPYTRALVDAASGAGLEQAQTRRRPLRLVDPEPLADSGSAQGCVFRSRCPRAADRCEREAPVLRPCGHGGRLVACHFPELEVSS